MKLIFSWKNDGVELASVCTVAREVDDEISPISCLLMDDGGLNLTHSLEWIDKGLEILSFVMSGALDLGNWDREYWGAEICHTHTKIYSLRDEECAESVQTEEFNHVLGAWRKFLGSREDGDTLAVNI